MEPRFYLISVTVLFSCFGFVAFISLNETQLEHNWSILPVCFTMSLESTS